MTQRWRRAICYVFHWKHQWLEADTHSCGWRCGICGERWKVSRSGERAIGTWFYEGLGDGWFDLLQECEDGPHLVGKINSEASVQFICEKMNEAPCGNGGQER